MRYRMMATYRGSPYEAGIGPADGEVVLFAACPPPEELGFEPATGHWRKELPLQDVQAVWESRPVGTFRGDRCIVLDDLGDRLHIGYLGHDAYRAEQLGYWQVDRGVFELVAARDEVADIVEERTDYPHQAGAQPQPGYPSRPAPADADYPGLAEQVTSAFPIQLGGPTAPGRMMVPDGGVALPPPAAEPPLPLEAEALRAASAASRRDQLTGPLSTGPRTGPNAVPHAVAPQTGPHPAGLPTAGPQTGPHAAGPRPSVSQSSVPAPAVPVPAVPTPAVSVPAPAPESAARYQAEAAPQPAATGRAAAPRGGTSVLQAAPVPAAAVPAAAAPVQAPPTLAGPATAIPLTEPFFPAAGLPAAGLPASGSPAAGSPATALASSPAVAPAPVRSTFPAVAVPAPAPAPLGATAPGRAVPPSPAASASPPALPTPDTNIPRRRRAARRRMATERIFGELASLAAIPETSYSVGDEVEGAMCLLETSEGFEVFSCAGGARHEVRVFSDEESACFYLFGVLAADAVRTGGLVPGPSRLPVADATMPPR